MINEQDLKKAENSKVVLGENQGFMRIMSYYKPKWMAVVTFFTGILNSTTMSLHGMFQGKV